MLEQILKDMWVDPEILAELDDTQKQTLFCRMREEQVRRWRLRDQQEQDRKDKDTEMRKKSKEVKKNVTFLQGEDGEPWVWVMGEHENDRSIDSIIEEEARETARLQAESEASELRKTVEAELSELIDLNQKNMASLDQESMMMMKETEKIDNNMDIYCSVDELREKIKAIPMINMTTDVVCLNNQYNQIQSNNYSNNINSGYNGGYNSVNKNFSFSYASDRRDVLQELTMNKKQPQPKVASRVALWERRVIGERTSEIFKRIQKKQMESVKEAEEAATRQEQLWREQERKAKQAEFQIREIARRAREEHRRTSYIDTDRPRDAAPPDAGSPNHSPPNSLEAGMARPPNTAAVLEWYRDTECKRGAGLERDGQMSPWFHGLVTRQEAEKSLSTESQGSFLVRLSERIWGYAISYRASDRIKHYLVDASNMHYRFLGENQLHHRTLGDLILYHGTEPITIIGGELLQRPCPSKRPPLQPR